MNSYIRDSYQQVHQSLPLFNVPMHGTDINRFTFHLNLSLFTFICPSNFVFNTAMYFYPTLIWFVTFPVESTASIPSYIFCVLRMLDSWSVPPNNSVLLKAESSIFDHFYVFEKHFSQFLGFFSSFKCLEIDENDGFHFLESLVEFDKIRIQSVLFTRNNPSASRFFVHFSN